MRRASSDAFRAHEPKVTMTCRPPTDGDTKKCPQCRDTLVFSSRYAVLSVGMALVTTVGGERERMRYERAWVCRNGGCDYREFEGAA
jgi:hypothetical protein